MRGQGALMVAAVTLVAAGPGCGTASPPIVGDRSSSLTVQRAVAAASDAAAVDEAAADQDRPVDQQGEQVGQRPGGEVGGQVGGEVGEAPGAEARRPGRPAPRPPVSRPVPRIPRGPRGPIVIVPGPPIIGVPAQSPTVAIAGLQFQPATITVPVGATVTWVNQDAVTHTVTSPPTGTVQTIGAFDGTVPPGATFVFTFNAPGEFQYLCRIHPEMRGTVNVVDTTATEPGPEEPPATLPATDSAEPATGSAEPVTGAARPATGVAKPAESLLPRTTPPRTGGYGY